MSSNRQPTQQQPNPQKKQAEVRSIQNPSANKQQASQTPRLGNDEESENTWDSKSSKKGGQNHN